MGEVTGLNLCEKDWFLQKKKNKPLELFADFDLCMKMEKAIFNFLMETCSQPKEIREIDLIPLE